MHLENCTVANICYQQGLLYIYQNPCNPQPFIIPKAAAASVLVTRYYVVGKPMLSHENLRHVITCTNTTHYFHQFCSHKSYLDVLDLDLTNFLHFLGKNWELMCFKEN